MSNIMEGIFVYMGRYCVQKFLDLLIQFRFSEGEIQNMSEWISQQKRKYHVFVEKADQVFQK